MATRTEQNFEFVPVRPPARVDGCEVGAPALVGASSPRVGGPVLTGRAVHRGGSVVAARIGGAFTTGRFAATSTDRFVGGPLR